MTFGPNGTLNDSLYRLSTATGLATPVSSNPSTSFSSISGLALVPDASTAVPEPTTLVLFGVVATVALGGGMIRRRRKAA